MRFEKEINIYGDEAAIKRFKANETSIKVLQGNISAMISESELVELQNSQATMYSKLASAVLSIKSLDLKFSDLTTKYNTVTGQYSDLDSKVAEYKAGVDGLSADISTVRQNLEGNYSTTTAMNAAISAKVEELSMSVSSTYSRKSDLIDASNRINELETWKKEAAIKITDNAIVSTVTKSSAYQNSVNSLIEQKADSIRLKADRISWESTYSSMTAWGTLTCENATIKGTLYSENGKNRAYLRNGQMQIFFNNQELGLIGGNSMLGHPNIEGLSFDLEETGDYMAWAAQKPSGSSYTVKMLYARSSFAHYIGDHINFDCNLNLSTRDIVGGVNGSAKIVMFDDSVGIRSAGGFSIKTLNEGHIAWFDSTSIILSKPVYANIAGIPSDERIKTNIRVSNVNALDLFRKVIFREFDWIESGGHESVGLIAQELEKTDPNLVRESRGIKYIDTTRLLWYCAKAIQEMVYNNTPQTRKARTELYTTPKMSLEEKKQWIREIHEAMMPQKTKMEETVIYK